MPDAFEGSVMNKPPEQSGQAASPQNGNAAQGQPALTAEQQQYFERRQKEFERGVERKFSELAETRKSLEQSQAQLLSYAQQLAMQAHGPSAQQTRAQRLSEMLDPLVADRMDAGGKSVLDLIGQHMGETIDARTTPLLEKLSGYEHKITELESKLTQREQREEHARIQREALEVSKKYGEDVVREYAPQIGQVLQAVPGMNIETALRIAAPHVLEQHVRRQVESEFAQRRENQFGAGLEGIFPEPSTSPNPEYSPGESMFESAMRANDPAQIRTEILKEQLKARS